MFSCAIACYEMRYSEHKEADDMFPFRFKKSNEMQQYAVLCTPDDGRDGRTNHVE